jgi:putative inorganic carbon (HCO3(-)) transporter
MLDPRGGVFISIGLFSHHLTFGGYYMLAFLLALAIVLSHKKKGILRILDFAAPVIIGLSLVFSYARSAWLGVVMGILTFGFLKGRKFALYLSLSMIILLLAVFAIEPTSWDRIKEISLSRDKDKAETTRIRLWQTSINMIKDKPIWGIGPGNFGELFDRYKVEGYYDNNSHPHNDFLNITVNSGLLGFFTYMSIWIVFLYTTVKVMVRKKKTGSNSWMQIAGLASIIAFLFAGLLQCYYSDAEVNMLVMFILGITVVSNLKTKENIPA